jgi:hypothetical protein
LLLRVTGLLLLRVTGLLLLLRIAGLLLRIAGLLLRIPRLLLSIAGLLPVARLSVSRLSLLPSLGILRRGLLFFAGAHGDENKGGSHHIGSQ